MTATDSDLRFPQAVPSPVALLHLRPCLAGISMNCSETSSSMHQPTPGSSSTMCCWGSLLCSSSVLCWPGSWPSRSSTRRRTRSAERSGKPTWPKLGGTRLTETSLQRHSCRESSPG